MLDIGTEALSSTSYGEVMMEARLKKGWSRNQLAELYGQLLREKAVSEKRIEMMEEHNDFPKSQKRRYLLAQILGISPALFGLPLLDNTLKQVVQPVEKINITAHRSLIQGYKEQNHSNTATSVVDKILEGMYTIHDSLPYAVKQTTRTELHRLLAEYHQFLSDLFRDQQQYAQSISHLNKAYIVAKQTQDDTLKALVLFRRGLTHHESGDLDRAIMDFQASLAINSSVLNLKGTTLMSLGHVQSHAAINHASLDEALTNMDKAEGLLGNNEPDMYFLKFNEEGYHLNRASALLGARNKSLHSPDQALIEIALVPNAIERKRRYGYSMILQARAWFDDGEYPMATTLAIDALSIVKEINSGVNIGRINDLYQGLQQTSYRNSTAVASLGVELLKVQHPELFQ